MSEPESKSRSEPALMRPDAFFNRLVEVDLEVCPYGEADDARLNLTLWYLFGASNPISA